MSTYSSFSFGGFMTSMEQQNTNPIPFITTLHQPQVVFSAATGQMEPFIGPMPEPRPFNSGPSAPDPKVKSNPIQNRFKKTNKLYHY